MNIIIPVAGLGQRFSEDNYILPKPLVRALGKPILFWNIEHLKVTDNDIIYIVYRKEFDKYNFTNILKHNFLQYNFRFIPIDSETRGAAETVLYAIASMSEQDKKQPTLIIDSDNFYEDDIIAKFKTNMQNIIFYAKNTEKNPIYSYILLDKNYEVLDIREKEKISDNACVGVYGFQNAVILEKNIKDIIINNKKQKNEFYISSVYKNLLDQNIDVLGVEIHNFVSLGTPRALQSFSSNLNKVNKKFRFCFDLDNTLVSYPNIKNDYTTVEPLQDNINYLNFLHNQGHTIIIYTARRMKTHGGNVGKVQADIAKITIDTLHKFNIQYDELYFGKPYADFYIDDLAIKAYDNLEKEIGIYNIHPKPRDHNTIIIKDNTIIKYSKQIDGEKYFYLNIPNKIKDKFPELLDSDENHIKISKINGLTISALYINDLLTDNIFKTILESIELIHDSASTNNQIPIYDNYTNKIINRINNYDFSKFTDFEKISNDILLKLKLYQENNKGKLGVIHGDPVFSNILIDTNNNIKFIDMRGKLGNTLSIYGDIFYDFGKIYQSIIGYDFILMNKSLNYNTIDKFKNLFHQYITHKFGNDKMQDIIDITKGLIISMIPLHDNEKIFNYYNLIKDI